MLSGEIVGYLSAPYGGVAELKVRDNENKIHVVLCDEASTQRALAQIFPGDCFLGEYISYEVDELGTLTGVGPISL